MKRRFLAISLLITVIVVLVVVQLAGNRLIAPKRASLTDYHYEILADPGDHGLTITEGTSVEGTPYLLCRPGSRLSGKGRILRQQLQKRGLTTYPPANSTLLILHGHGGRKEDSLPIAERFCAAGFNCLLPDLPGHGSHPDKIATFGKREVPLLLNFCKETALVHHLRPAFSLLGFSQGGAIALQLAAHPQSDISIVAVTSFSTFANLAESVNRTARQSTLLKTIRPLISLNLSLRYGLDLTEISPAQSASLIHSPTLIVHGDQDRLIPVADGLLIHQNLGTPSKRLIIIKGAGHSDTLIKGDELYADMSVFFLESHSQK